MKASATDTVMSVGEEATNWLFELQGADDEVRAAFFVWLRQSPRHVEEFLFATAMWRKLHRFGEDHPLKVEQLLAEAAAEDERCLKVVKLRQGVSRVGERNRAQWWRGRRALAIAACVAALAAGAVFLQVMFRSGPIYTTAAGEQRILRLEDGSMVRLNTRSRLAVEYSASSRHVRLLEGEALFTVQQESARPFRVESGDTVIQAIGTQFSVYRRKSGTTVSVIEGAVRVSADDSSGISRLVRREVAPGAPSRSVQLKAGEQANADSSGSIERQIVPDVARAVAWQDQRVIFRSDRLEDAVAEVNRYGSRPIRVEGQALRDMRISAIFDANDPESLVRFLQKFDGVAVESTSEEVIIRPNAAR